MWWWCQWSRRRLLTPRVQQLFEEAEAVPEAAAVTRGLLLQRPDLAAPVQLAPAWAVLPAVAAVLVAVTATLQAKRWEFQLLLVAAARPKATQHHCAL